MPQTIPEIVVTDRMVDAGIDELYECHYGDDWRYVLERVFRAMAYESIAEKPDARS
jgi:hypothetical protein